MITGAMYDTLLFLHVLAAFLLVAVLGLYWAMYAVDSVALVRLSGIALALWGLASVSVLVFGIWLAFDNDFYDAWEAWIVAAVVLWLVQGAFGSKLSQGYKKMAGGVAERPALSAHVIASVAVILLLIDMVWKPGS
jgi:hypothetical protein